MWQFPDDEPEDAPPVADGAQDGPDTDLVLELVSDGYVQSAMFTTLARVNKHLAAKARLLFDAFLDQLTATSRQLGKASAERNKAFWRQNRMTSSMTAVSYSDRAEWHYWNQFAARCGEGTCNSMYAHTIPTRDQTFSDQTERQDFERALARAMTPCHYYKDRKRHAWIKRHVLCAPLFVKGPINFFKRMAIPNSALYDIVVHGDASRVPTEGFAHRHHRFFVQRLLEERVA